MALTGTADPRRDEQARRTVIDWIVAVACYPVTLTLMLAPSGLYEEEHRALAPDATPGLVFRFLPGLLPEGVDAALANPGVTGSLLLAGVPALASWAALYRRTRPARLLVVSVALLLLFANIVPIAIALFSHAAWSTDRRRLAGWSTAAAVAFFSGVWGTAALGWPALTVFMVAFVTPLSLGLWAGTRRRLVASLRAHAGRLERERQLMTERATVAERTRIAREMHDVVAHRVSLMVLHAGALELSATDPALAESAGQVRAAGREALGELRDILGVLRDDLDEVPTTPQPGLADIEQLIDDWRSAGMTIRWESTGTPRRLPGRLERTAYRVLQEALTNAAKHAPGRAVRIHLGHSPQELTLSVVNEMPPADHERSARGYGLTGISERIAVTGGKLTIGPRPDGTWQLHVTLPTGLPPPDDAALTGSDEPRRAEEHQ